MLLGVPASAAIAADAILVTAGAEASVASRQINLSEI